jgi:hypothetical protein
MRHGNIKRVIQTELPPRITNSNAQSLSLFRSLHASTVRQGKDYATLLIRAMSLHCYANIHSSHFLTPVTRTPHPPHTIFLGPLHDSSFFRHTLTASHSYRGGNKCMLVSDETRSKTCSHTSKPSCIGAYTYSSIFLARRRHDVSPVAKNMKICQVSQHLHHFNRLSRIRVGHQSFNSRLSLR